MPAFRSHGFTLIETLIYVAILSMIGGISALGLAATIRATTTLRATAGLSDGAALAFERMMRSVRGAESVVVASSTLGAHPGVLTLSSGVSFYLATGTLLVQAGTSSPEILLSPRFPVSNLVFRNVKTASSSGVILEATIDGRVFRSTAVMRGSY